VSGNGSPRATVSGVQELPPPVEPSWADLGYAPWVEPFAKKYLRSAVQLLGLYAVVRIGLVLTDVLAAHLKAGGNLDGPLSSWDGGWYLTVAAHGYIPQHGAHLTFGAGAFEPVFPLLIAALGWMGGTVAAAATISILAGAASVILVWRLGAAVFDECIGWIGAVLFTVFPGMGIAWGVLYSECVGLALAAACLLLMIRRRWLWSGIFGLLATATSPMALPLALAATVPVIQDLRKRKVPGALLTMVLVPLGFMAYVAYVGAHYHDALYWWHLQHAAWAAVVDWGKSLALLLVHPMTGGYQGKGWMEWLGVAAVAGAIWALVKAKPPAVLTVYCGGVFLLLFASNSLGFKPRLLTWAFPALIAVGAVLRRRGWQIVAIAFAYLVPLVFLIYTTYGNYFSQP